VVESAATVALLHVIAALEDVHATAMAEEDTELSVIGTWTDSPAMSLKSIDETEMNLAELISHLLPE